MVARVPRPRRGPVGGLALPLVAATVVLSCASPLPAVRRIAASEGAPAEVDHRGPSVPMGSSGTARFVAPLFEAFRPRRAMELVTFADRFYRTPANPGFDAVLDRIHDVLSEAGYGTDPRLELYVIEQDLEHPAWTPLSGRLVLHTGRRERVLHAFDAEDGRDRTLLPVHAPSAEVEGGVALSLRDLDPGEFLVTDAASGQVLDRAQAQGAAGVLSASLFPFNVDPSGAERHLDAIQYRQLPPGTELPVGQISPRAYAAIRKAVEDGDEPRLTFRAQVQLEARPLRTLVATVIGDRRPEEVVAISSHVQEPGACDNASGLAGLAEGARSLSQLLTSGALPWPDRTLVFLWGDEFVQTRSWLDRTERTVFAGLSSDMTGQSADTGAIALLERHPDPGALVTLPPDEHTDWGAFEVDEAWVLPNGLAVVARCALADVAVHAGGWTTADHPWEGGSDHDVFIKRGIPAVLFWHFTDFTYHTSLDRPEFVDPEEMRRMGTAILATALALADPVPGDLDRYLKALLAEERVRVGAAEEAGREDSADAWRRWTYGARMWLRTLCLGPEAVPPPSVPKNRPSDG